MKKLYAPYVRDKDGIYRKPMFAESKEEVIAIIEKYNKTHKNEIKIVGQIPEPDFEI